MENFIYNPINDKFPSGASIKGTKVTYKIQVSKFLKATEVNFVMYKDGEEECYYPMTKIFTDEKYCHYEFEYKFTQASFYWYHFNVVTKSRSYNLIRSDNYNVVDSEATSDYLQLIINSEESTDQAFKKGIIYHIFVDRFNRSGKVRARNGLHLINDWEQPVEKEYENGERVNKNCYGGNLQGVIDKLDYLKGLNVSTIYLSPIFEANSSHKYDTADYSKIDSMFGDMDTLQTLIDKAKKKGMRIILDGVFNHTGSDSVYFNREGRYKTIGAYQSTKSKYYSWYDFDSYPNVYSCWWGIKTLPQTNEQSGFFDFIAGENGIINKYMKMGLGGFRLDVVDELTNNFLSAICKAIRKVNPKALIVGEVWEDASSKMSYDERKNYFLGGNLNSVTNYPMKNAILNFVKTGDVNDFVSTVAMIKDQYPVAIQNNLMNILDTHDTIRALTYLSVNSDDAAEIEDNAIKLMKLATLIQYTIMGIPTLFYGDEAGLRGVADPYCRKTYPWGKENQELLEWYKQLGILRNNKALDGGVLNIKYANDGVLVYERVKGEDKLMVAINRSGTPFEFTLERTMTNYFTCDYVSGKVVIESNDSLVLI